MILRTLNIGFLSLFAVATFLQINDPDFFLWMPIYASATILCLMFHLRHKLPLGLSAIYFASCFLGGCYQAVQLTKNPLGLHSEVFNEVAGLFLVSGWTLIILVTQEASLGQRARYKSA